MKVDIFIITDTEKKQFQHTKQLAFVLLVNKNEMSTNFKQSFSQIHSRKGLRDF